ncbi:hypothetical protein, partial [Bacillus haynesii]|uniref:hypothetical protein n=1 Tax=Bacillus haynesii TaxID=1925021 RepID=UPI002282DD1F
TEVKLFSADGSWGLPPVRVGRRQALRKTSLYQLVFFIAVQLFITEGQCIDDFNSSGPAKR